VAFRARFDGSIQHYVELAPLHLRRTRTCDLMIALHGMGSDRWQYINDPRGECKGARDTAARHGMIYVSPDYRAPASWMNAAAEADLVQIIRELRGRYRIGRVFLVGGSMGGASVLTFTALHPDMVDGVVSENGVADHLWYSNLQDHIAHAFGGTKEQAPSEYRKRSAASSPGKFTMPTAITSGGRDSMVPPESVLKFAETLRQMGRKVLVIHRPETGHLTSYEDTVKAIEFVINAASVSTQG
jgi:pimeloyl-ACP methyl ester carboxylesterase